MLNVNMTKVKKDRKRQKSNRSTTQPCSFRMIYRKYQSYFNISDEVVEWLTDHHLDVQQEWLTDHHLDVQQEWLTDHHPDVQLEWLTDHHIDVQQEWLTDHHQMYNNK